MKKTIKLIILSQLILLVLFFMNIYEQIEEVNLLYKNKDTILITMDEITMDQKDFINPFIQVSKKYKTNIYKYAKDKNNKKIIYTTGEEDFNKKRQTFHNRNNIEVFSFKELILNENITGKDIFYIDSIDNIDNLVRDLKRNYNDAGITYANGNDEEGLIFDFVFNNILYIIYCCILMFINVLLYIILINSNSKKIAILQSNGYTIINTISTYFKPVLKWLSFNSIIILTLAHIYLFIKWRTIKMYNLLIMLVSTYYIIFVFVLLIVLFLMVKLQYNKSLNSRIKSRKTYSKLVFVVLIILKIVITLVIVIVGKEIIGLNKDYKEFKSNIEYFESTNSKYNSRYGEIYKLRNTTPINDTKEVYNTFAPLYKQAKKFIFFP